MSKGRCTNGRVHPMSGLIARPISLCLAIVSCLVLGVPPAAADGGSWIGEIGGVGSDHATMTTQSSNPILRGNYTVTATNTGTDPWGGFHFGIFDPTGVQDISSLGFLDASTGGEDPTSTQSGLTWTINNDVVGATIDLHFCSDPVLPGETATFSVLITNPEHVSFFGVLFYPTPVPRMGACCRPDGACVLTCRYDCVPPAIWLGETICEPDNPCPQPTGACCFDDGRCETLTEQLCIASPGFRQWLGGLVDCTPESPCPQPGACCDPTNGVCRISIEADCRPPSTWDSRWTTCDPVTCPSPVPSRDATWGQIKATYR